MHSRKHFIFGAVFGAILLFSFLFSFPDGKLHIIFCNVGQGDATYIRTPSNLDMLIDGGPNDQVLSCLGKHMPFYDRTIDVVVLSHPQKDHLQGLLSVLKRYHVKNFIIGAVGNETEGYKKLVEIVKEKKIPVKNLYAGDSFSLGKVEFSVLWPEKEWVVEHTSETIASDRTRNLQVGAVLGLSTDTELNDFSYILHLSYGSFDALFPGDGDSHIQDEVMRAAVLPDVEVLKYPHHGSKTAVLPQFLDKIKPEEAVIFVGKNPWGHPTDEALKLLSNRAVKIRRTDREGEIEIISDGKN
jgi:competence protein ComEC